MSKILKTKIHVNEEGEALVPYEILEPFIDASLRKLPFEFNDAENKIKIFAGMSKKNIETYENNTVIQRRKVLYFDIKKKRIKENEDDSKKRIELLSIKLASLEDPSKIPEILKEIENVYEKDFMFRFNKSNYLSKFYNQDFDIELNVSKNKEKFKEIIFDFKNVDDITPRILDTKIQQGTLLIHKDGPPKVVNHFMDKDYIILKLFTLMDQHSDELKHIYDILITCNEQTVNQIFQGKNHDNQNVFFGKYTKKGKKNSQNFYISKLKFGEFLKSSGQKFFKIPHKVDQNEFEVPFYEEIYDQYLLENTYTQKELDDLKEKAIKGISKYFSHYFAFLTYLKEDKSKILYKDISEKDIYIIQGIVKSIEFKTHVSDDMAYDHYLTICNSYGSKAYTKQVFDKHVEILKEQKFISLRKKKGSDEKRISLSQKSFDFIEKLRLYDEIHDILEILNDLDFSIPIKREIFNVDVKVHFLDDMNILITRDKNLEIDYSANLLLDGLENNIKKGKNLFLKEYNMLLENKELYKIDDKFYKNIFYTLKNLKFTSALNFHSEFIKDCFYYFGILKNNADLIKSYFRIKDFVILDTIAIIFGIQNSFRKHFPKENSIAYYELFFTSKFVNFPEIKASTMFKIRMYCQDMIFIFEATQDLKSLQRKLKDKFHTNIEFKSILTNIETLINQKMETQDDLGEIFETIKGEIQTKKRSPQSVSEFTKILDQKLKGELSEVEYIETIKSLEDLLTSKMKPIVDLDSILKQIDHYFNKKTTSAKQLDKIIEYADKNLKNEFEDKEKFTSILEAIKTSYDSKIKYKKTYSTTLNRLKKSFDNLDTEEAVQKVQSYIEENLKDVFESSQECQSVFRQIDREFLNKTENPKELDDIIKLSSDLVKIFIADTVWHSILVASIFTGFILALDKDKEIPIGSICKTLNVLPTSVSLHIKKLLSTHLEDKKITKFDSLKITDEETRQNLRFLLVKKLLDSSLYMIFKTDKNKKRIRFSEKFKLQIDFFSRHEKFNDSLGVVSKLLIDKYVKEYISEIKQTKKIEDKNLRLSNLSGRLTFFNSFYNFLEFLVSLKSEIKDIYGEIPDPVLLKNRS